MYKGLSRAQLSYDYLHTNSTTHEFLFGALAELLDNARDAFATKINIYSVFDQSLRGGYILCFLDDGQGMSPEESSDIITFGKSTKKSLESQMVGMYGNGLKSGSMRIGNDFILFTKKASTLTCVFLSRTFHELEQLDEIIVPMPSFDSQTKKPLAKTPKEKEKHILEMELILKYSPFKTEAQFMKEFDKIEGSSGTLVIIYNLKLLDSGQPELDVKTDPYDIILTVPEGMENDSDEGLMPERKSFRAYASILYVEPRMRVYIQGKKVRTKRLISTLYKPRMYKYTSGRFKTRSENEAKKSEEASRSAENRAREAESKAKNLEMKYGTAVDKEQRIELRKAQTVALELRKEAMLRKTISERKSKALRDPKQLMFVFGMNIDNRSRDGMFVYNCSRLIKMYQKVGPQADGGVFCSGVVGVVDVPYLVLEPTHNKQDFADAKEYRHLQQAMGEHMMQYWKDIEIAQQGVSKFWENFGYISPNWRDLPSSDPKFIRKRTAQVQITLQCDLCLKWRIIPFSANNIGRVFPDDWVCSMNPDPAHNRCSSTEEKLNLPEGVLRKVPKTKEQKEKELAEEIKKKQDQLDKMQQKQLKARKESSSSSSSSSDDVEEVTPVRGRHQTNIANYSKQSQSSNSQSRPPTRRPIESSGSDSGDSSSISSVSEYKRGQPPPKKKVSPQKTFLSTAKRTSGTLLSIRNSSFKDSRKTPSADVHRRAEKKQESKPEPKPKWNAQPTARKSVRNEISPVSAKRKPVNDDDKSDIEERKTSRFGSRGRGSATPTSRGRRRSSSDDGMAEDDSPRKGDSSEEVEKDDHAERRRRGSEMSVEDEPLRQTNKSDTVVEKGVSPVRPDDDTDVGTRVKVLINNKWLFGNIEEMNQAKDRCKVRLDKNNLDVTEKWFAKNRKELQVVSATEGTPVEGNETEKEEREGESKKMKAVEESVPSSQAATNNVHKTTQDLAAETPSSSTIAATPSSIILQAHDEIANGYRTCLRYFLPPQWVMDKETVSTLGVQELAAFPLDDFFNQYEKGLRKLVSSFQQEAQLKQHEAEQASSKLSSVRKMIAKLLKTINEEFEIEPECDTDDVDELLALCLKQALAHAKTVKAGDQN